MREHPRPPGDLRFSIATCGDIDAVVTLVEAAYRGDPSRRGWTTEADYIEGQRVNHEMVNEVLTRPGSLILMGHQGDELVACCELTHRDEDREVYLGMFAVDPALQAGGIGRQVLEEAERIAAADWGARRVTMTVVEIRYELVAWYARRGYLPTGQTVPFPYDDERYGRPTRPDLRFVVLAKELASTT